MVSQIQLLKELLKKVKTQVQQSWNEYVHKKQIKKHLTIKIKKNGKN